MSKKTVVVGMSGGVDSSVAAYLLKKQGYDVIGVTMQIWQDDDPLIQEENGGCCGTSAVWDARAVAERLEIPYYVMNFKDDFKKYVIDYFNQEYLQGRTPNPCIACNRYVKWECLLQRSLDIGAHYIATGHYANIVVLPNGRYAIKNAVTATKDQTYALYNLNQEQLKRTLMPVGNYEKTEIRKIAEKIGLTVANKPDSQDICFIPDHDYGKYLRKTVKNIPGEGNFVSTTGDFLGKHKGYYNYTIGQRRGLGLAMGHHVFVKEIRPETNEVVICDNEELMSNTLYCDTINLMSVEEIPKDTRVLAKIRYNHKGSMATINQINNNLIQCVFDEPQRAITPGQAVVFYDGEIVLGGGTIIGTEAP